MFPKKDGGGRERELYSIAARNGVGKKERERVYNFAFHILSLLNRMRAEKRASRTHPPTPDTRILFHQRSECGLKPKVRGPLKQTRWTFGRLQTCVQYQSNPAR